MNTTYLADDEIVGHRPFTHPKYTIQDLRLMNQMWVSLRGHIQAVNTRQPAGVYLYSVLEKANGDVHQIVLANRRLILVTRPAFAVGYFGQTRPDVDHTPNFSVRLHNGLLPAGILGDRPIQLTVTKYFDFSQKPPWRAVRHLST